MKCYKYRKLYYCFNLITVLIGILTIMIFKDWFVLVIDSVCIGLALLDVVKKLFYSICVGENAIVENSINKINSIMWNEIETIILLPTSRGNKVFIGIYAKEKKLFLTFWLSNYRGLLRTIINICSTNSKINIEPKIFEIL